MLCAIWYQLQNLKNVKNTYGEKLLLVKLYKLYHIAQRHTFSLLHEGSRDLKMSTFLVGQHQSNSKKSVNLKLGFIDLR